jgi:hypothetical protein
MNTNWTLAAGALLLLSAAVVGCGRNAPAPAPGGGAAQPAAEEAHPTEGPHGGELVELGNEEYHGELVHHKNAGTVTIYVLDGEARDVVPIESTEITINLTHGGQAEQFKLTASPEESDPAGRSSRFVSSDEELAAHLEEEGTNAELVITIEGKQYRGKIEHHHEEGEEK